MASDNPMDNDDANGFDFNRELEKILREFLSGSNPDSLKFLTEGTQGMPGISFDPSSLGQIFSMFQSGANTSAGATGIDWSIARKTAIDVAKERAKPQDVPQLNATFSTASLWVDEATVIGASAVAPKEITPVEWVQVTIDTWIKIVEPVAEAISQVLLETFEQQVPEEIQSQLSNISAMITKVGGSMFALQLGQIVGKLATEVISGGDVGIPLTAKESHLGGTLIPENIPAFLDGISQSETEVLLFLAARELAYARLFRHSKWLDSHVEAIVREYAAGIEIDMEHFHDLASEFDPSDANNLQELMRNGSLIPPKTPRQEAAHERLETLIALVDGWVDVVTISATNRIPGSPAIAEMMRRRRATGGPSERAFATLIGLEMRPRKLREASVMWQLLEEKTDISTRDSLWAHPDLLPTKEEIENPSLLVARVQGKHLDDGSENINFDQELAKLLEDNKDQDDNPEKS
ncbi:MAG TPA: zinc-dependent metalloprotease [Microbacteriaceae bacterium]|nr:zinc-dependent metalloprotease [Microbacteriaceae bacterium]